MIKKCNHQPTGITMLCSMITGVVDFITVWITGQALGGG